MINLYSFLIIGIFLFVLGIYTVFTRKNIIGILMGIELMLNAASLNFVAFNFYRGMATVSGHVFSAFIIVLAAAEAVVALAIVLAVFQQRKSLDIDQVNELRG